MRDCNHWDDLIRSAMEEAGIGNQTFIENAQLALSSMAGATCLVKRGQDTGSGMLVMADDLGFCVYTCNHCVPDDNAARETNVIFDYDQNDGKIDKLRSFDVTLEASSVPWTTEDEMDQDHLDYSMLKLQVATKDDRDFLEARAGERRHLMLPVDIFPTSDDILVAIPGAPKYDILFMFSHPRGLAKRLSAGRRVPEVGTRPHTHYRLRLPHLRGSSGGNVLCCPPAGATYKHWWSVAMCNAGDDADCAAVAWSALLEH